MSQSYLQQLSKINDKIKVDALDEHSLRIDRTNKTPFVYLNGNAGIIVFTGTSVPDNAMYFYNPILDFVGNHFLETSEIQVFIHLKYCIGSSGKYFWLLLRKLGELYLQGKNVKVFWFQDEEEDDLYTSGHNYQILENFPFNVIELNDADLEEVDKLLSQF